MTSSARTQPSVNHVIGGLAMAALGAVGLVQFWDALGPVARGVVPFGLLGSGLVMVGAGVRAVRQNRRVSPGLAAVTPIVATIACVVLATAAASGVSVDLPNSWTPSLVAGYVALGFISGIVGGMLGLGGGVVHLSGLTLLFGFPFAFARGATLINNVFINGAAALRYGKRKLLLLHVAAVLLPASIIGVAGGSFLQESLDETLMRRIFAVFIVIVTVAIIIDTLKPRALAQTSTHVPKRHAIVGFLAGFVSGVLGVSGGVVAVPGQTLTGGVPLRQAIANSTLITACSSALGALLLIGVERNTLSATDMLTIAVLFVPGNLIGGHFGALWMERLPLVAVRGFFITVLVAITIRSWGW